MNEVEYPFTYLRHTVFLFCVWSFISFAHFPIELLVRFVFCFISKRSLYNRDSLLVMHVANISQDFTLSLVFAYSIFAMQEHFLSNVVEYINEFCVCVAIGI